MHEPPFEQAEQMNSVVSWELNSTRREGLRAPSGRVPSGSRGNFRSNSSTSLSNAALRISLRSSILRHFQCMAMGHFMLDVINSGKEKTGEFIRTYQRTHP